MKLRNLLLFASSATLAYQIVKNRKKITEEILEVGQLITDFQNQSMRFQDSLTRIQIESEHLQDVIDDISYEISVFSKVANARLEEIQTGWNTSDEQ